MLGLKEQQIPIEVKEDENTPVNYKLAKENILALQEVRIVGNNSKITRKESPYVAKLPIKYLKIHRFTIPFQRINYSANGS
jgi:iron complex outermembrane receptor protein